MAAHEDRGAGAQCARKIAPLMHVGHQQVRVAEIHLGIPDRNVRANRGADMHDRAQLLADHAERHDAIAVAVDDSLHIGTRFVDRAVNEAFEIGLAVAPATGAPSSVNCMMSAASINSGARPRDSRNFCGSSG